MKRIVLIFLITLAILIGMYPVAYFLFDMRMGLLGTKSPELLADQGWNRLFYLHISFGGIALLTGCSQFLKGFRNRNLPLHRVLGKAYLVSISISGLSGLYIAFFSTGGIVAAAGFICLALGWLFTSAMAYQYIRKKNRISHEHWMIRSYALCFAAVTLRIWLPLLEHAVGFDFLTSYRLVAWLCWVPNLMVAEYIVRNTQATRVESAH